VESPAAHSDRSRSWGDIVRAAAVPEVVEAVNAKDYGAAGVRMANSVIERTPDGRALELEAQAADLLWGNAPGDSDPGFLELLSSYRDTLNEYVHRGDDR
jgi:hypothetical protein